MQMRKTESERMQEHAAYGHMDMHAYLHVCMPGHVCDSFLS